MLVVKQCVYTAGKLVADNHLGGASCGEETPVRSKHLPGALLFQATLPDTLHTAARGSQSRSNATPQSPLAAHPSPRVDHKSCLTRRQGRNRNYSSHPVQKNALNPQAWTNPDQLQIAIATRMTGRTYHPRSKQTCPCRLTPNKTERPPQPRQHKPPTPTTTKQRTNPDGYSPLAHNRDFSPIVTASISPEVQQQLVISTQATTASTATCRAVGVRASAPLFAIPPLEITFPHRVPIWIMVTTDRAATRFTPT